MLDLKGDKMNQLTAYIRNSRRQKIGVLFATKRPEAPCADIGWSLCSKRDKFNRERGLQIARARAVVGSVVSVPRSIRAALETFQLRVDKYFKVDSGFGVPDTFLR